MSDPFFILNGDISDTPVVGENERQTSHKLVVVTKSQLALLQAHAMCSAEEGAARMKEFAEAASESAHKHQRESDNLRAHADRSKRESAKARRRAEGRRENATRTAVTMTTSGTDA